MIGPFDSKGLPLKENYPEISQIIDRLAKLEETIIAQQRLQAAYDRRFR